MITVTTVTTVATVTAVATVTCVTCVVMTAVGLVSIVFVMAGVPTGLGAGVGVSVVHGSVLSLQFIVVVGSAVLGA